MDAEGVWLGSVSGNLDADEDNVHEEELKGRRRAAEVSPELCFGGGQIGLGTFFSDRSSAAELCRGVHSPEEDDGESLSDFEAEDTAYIADEGTGSTTRAPQQPNALERVEFGMSRCSRRSDRLGRTQHLRGLNNNNGRIPDPLRTV